MHDGLVGARWDQLSGAWLDQLARVTRDAPDRGRSDLHARYAMERIDHGQSYSLPGGVYTNGAEEFFSRCVAPRSAIITTSLGRILVRCAQEAAWREDRRRVDNGRQVQAVMGLAIACRPSVDRCGYWQRGR